MLSLVKDVVTSKQIDAIVSDGWWTSFKKRHGCLSLRVAEKLSYTRAVSSSPEILNSYFDLLEETMKQNDLFDKPSQIFNLDESGMPQPNASQSDHPNWSQACDCDQQWEQVTDNCAAMLQAM